MIRINKINIDQIGPIKELELNFSSKFNIICGQNGIGKTTILDCLAQSFAGSSSTLKKRAGAEMSSWDLEVSIDSKDIQKTFDVFHFHPNETSRNYNGFYESSNEVVVFKTHRDIPYKKLSSLNTDKQKSINNFHQETIGGSLSDDLKNWFVNRFLFSAQKDTLDQGQLKNYELAKKCFSIVNPEIEFSKVLPNSFDIMLKTRAGDIYFEYLSSGYKSCLAVLLGVIMEIELRFKNPSIFIKEFQGVIIIDEIDLHLHPEWQANIYKSLKEILPNAQIFTSTHSPHIIQIANPDEIIALTLDENNDVKLNNIVNTEFGCQGWTVEEILEDVMGMKVTRTAKYLDAINNFNIAIDNENFKEAKKEFELIDLMLHPENSLRKILKIQLTGFEG